MRACVIFNPAAKGDKARRFRGHVDEIARQCAVKPTTCAGDARRLAREAVLEGFETIVAAGGDGTVNEVLNGIGDVPDGFDKARLAVLPIGTINVFARELAIPRRVGGAWQAIVNGKETRIDLPWAEYQTPAGFTRRYFAQLAGAGLDALAVELVEWPLKKRIGPLAYVWAGLKAMAGSVPLMTARVGDQTLTGELVLVGNGRFYGGNYHVFPGANLADGKLEVRVFPKVNWLTLARCGPQMLLMGTLPNTHALTLSASVVTVSSESRAPVEIDGELAGVLPAKFGLEPARLRVVVPAG